MSYEAWRITYQSSEQAARAAYATIARLTAEVEALRDDAERYRHLVKSGKFCPSVSNNGWALSVGASNPSTKAELDDAIDAAIAGAKP